MICQKPLIFWVTLSLALHVAILAWCPVPGFFSPPHPVYLVVDLFSGPATTGTGHGLDAESGGGGKPAPSEPFPLKEPAQSLPATSKPVAACKPQMSQNTTKPKPTHAKQASKQAPVLEEPQLNNTGPEQPSVANTSLNPVNGTELAATAKPLTSPQDNSGEVPATVTNSGTGTAPGTGFGAGSGTGSGSGSGTGRGSAGSGSPVETPFAYGSNPPPPYPSTARRRGWEGEVLLLVEVSAAGEVCKITVSRSSGYQILDSTALNAVYRWKFQAALRNGRAVSGKVLVPIRFDLKELE